MNLQNRFAIVTGGNAGIGKAIALKYAEAGARVAIFGTNIERGQQTAAEINQTVNQPDAVHFFQVDVSKTAPVEEAIKQVLALFGKVDILVNNAGITRDQLLMKMTEEDWDVVVDVNVKSCYNTCHALVRPMMKARYGKIINMTSVIGLIGNTGQANYAASKAAIIGFSKALAKELASRNICVNCIAPGYIDTLMTAGLDSSQKDAIISKIPMGRIGTPNDIAHLACFLASDLSNYITGQTFTVDGGMVM